MKRCLHFRLAEYHDRPDASSQPKTAAAPIAQDAKDTRGHGESVGLAFTHLDCAYEDDNIGNKGNHPLHHAEGTTH